MSHTPGPWTVGVYIDYRYGTPWPVFRLKLLEDPDPQGQEVQANRRLMEAAPELLEALRPFAHLTKVLEEGQMLNFRGVYVGFEDARSAAAAIDKATGKETP